MSVDVLNERLSKFFEDYSLSGEKEYLFKAQAELRKFIEFSLGKEGLKNENYNKH